MIRIFSVATQLLFFGVCFLSNVQLSAQTVIAEDKASDGAYTGGWKTGTNGGKGFGPWEINADANTGVFIGDPANDSMSTSGIGNAAFGMYATGVPYLDAKRSFNKPLAVGDEFSFYWVMNWDANGGSKGFDIKSGGTTVFNINNGSNEQITSSAETALRQYGTLPMLVKLKRTASDLYSFSMTGRVAGENYSTTINTALPVDGISFYIGFQRDGDGRRNIYFNNFKITSSAQTSVSDMKFNQSLSVYPNPAAGGTALQIEFFNKAPGKYTVIFFNTAGFRVQQTIVAHPGGTTVQLVRLSSSLSPGIYIAEITGNNGKKELLKLMVN